MKRVRVEAFLPQLAAAHVYQQAEGSGGSLSVAIGRAVDSVMAMPMVKGKRHQTLRLTIVVLE